MRSKVERHSEEAEKTVRDIRRATRRQYSAEEKIRIVIAGLRGEDSIAELCRKEGVNQNLYYRWSKDFLEAGKRAPGLSAALQAGHTNSSFEPHCSQKVASAGLSDLLDGHRIFVYAPS
jgi:transposase-like protein